MAYNRTLENPKKNSHRSQIFLSKFLVILLSTFGQSESTTAYKKEINLFNGKAIQFPICTKLHHFAVYKSHFRVQIEAALCPLLWRFVVHNHEKQNSNESVFPLSVLLSQYDYLHIFA